MDLKPVAKEQARMAAKSNRRLWRVRRIRRMRGEIREMSQGSELGWRRSHIKIKASVHVPHSRMNAAEGGSVPELAERRQLKKIGSRGFPSFWL